MLQRAAAAEPERLPSTRFVSEREPGLDTHMPPEATNTDVVAQHKPIPLSRYAIWSGAATVAVPVGWALLASALGGNAGLTVGWFGVLPVILFVPLGIVVTLVLTMSAVAQATETKAITTSSRPSKTNHDGRNG